ncbi:hypothetical protein CVT26_012197 [Gymnopilus dilepis]|uniref:DUF8040 domain-containing protein n=1 Tax=Gymnopilus dilepis TaxID=231916 RepID=A0A409WX51_9AGAR|nr:hypothetical protein CVT26_012197 [Gymnopilus dilepis]
MARTYFQSQALQEPADCTARRRSALIACVIATLAAASAVVEAYRRRYDPEPYHTSILSGEEWVQDLQDGHKDRIKDNLGVQKHVFRQLKTELCTKGGLRRRRRVSNDEQIAVFLYQLTTNLSVRKTAE